MQSINRFSFQGETYATIKKNKNFSNQETYVDEPIHLVSPESVNVSGSFNYEKNVFVWRSAEPNIDIKITEDSISNE